MLAHGVSEDIVASFAVKEKKAELPQWMLDLKTPVKRPKLPLPGFYPISRRTEAPGLHRRVGARVPNVDGLDGCADGCT